MNIKEKQQDTVDQEKPNFGQFIDTNKGASMRDLLKDGDSIVAKMQSVEKGQFQIIDLPSKGWGYAQNSPLSSGKIKLRLPTGKDQAILSSKNLQKKGIMIDQFLKAIIVDNIRFQDLLSGDKNYLIFASRRMAYGNDYVVQMECPKCSNLSKKTVDLSKFVPKETPALFDYPKETRQFEFTLPNSKKQVKIKQSTDGDEKQMEKRIDAMDAPELEILIRTAVLITQLDGKTQFREILEQLKVLPSKDTLAIRFFIQNISPDISIKFEYECAKCYKVSEVAVPLTVSFFWPGNE